MGNILLKIHGKAVVFPAVCPHCLQRADIPIQVKSPSRLAAHYVVATKWKYFTIQVPFCKDYARKYRNAQLVFASVLGLGIAIFITVMLITMSTLSDWQFVVLTMVWIGLAMIPFLFVSPSKHIKLVGQDDSCIEFAIRDRKYAQMLEIANGMAPSEINDGKRDDARSFAA